MAEPSGGMTIRTLGTFVFSSAGHTVQRWRAGKARNLLQFLLLHKGHVMTRTALEEALWPGFSNTSNSSSLKVAVHMLRSTLAEQNQRAAANCDGSKSRPHLRLTTHELGYALEARDVWVDFEVFDGLISTSQAYFNQGDTQKAAQCCAKAVDLYQGDFLAGETMHWADVQRTWLRSRALLALERLIECDITSRDYLAAVTHCRAILDMEPYREQTYRTLIMIHAHLGHLQQVREWYKVCLSRLERELGVGPDRLTVSVYERAMRGKFRTVPLDGPECLGV